VSVVDNRQVAFGEAVAVWWRIGLLSFGGPAGQIALMHKILVDEKKWLDENRFLHALNYCMMLPGPEAQQLATYVGWLLHGVKGGVAAGLLFILPGAAAILALSWLYVLLGDLTFVQGLFFGLKAAVLAIVVQAMIRIAKRALQGTLRLCLAMTAFVALFFFNFPFPLVVLGAAVIGYIAARNFDFVASVTRRTSSEALAGSSAAILLTPPDTRAALRAAIVCIVLWVATIAGLLLALGPDNVFSELAVFFSKMAVVTFGGAYAVLAYVAQQGVEQYQWLQPGEMLDGLGLAETTPGPLILVTQFVGFLAALRSAGEPVLVMATFGALLTTWVTFLPCFVWIFAGAPYVERLRENVALSAALSAVTAAIVGVIANLALWFALNLLFTETVRVSGAGFDVLVPHLESLDTAMLILAVLASVLLFIGRLHLLVVLGVTAITGIIFHLLM
jgi:chromate transporter